MSKMSKFLSSSIMELLHDVRKGKGVPERRWAKSACAALLHFIIVKSVSATMMPYEETSNTVCNNAES